MSNPRPLVTLAAILLATPILAQAPATRKAPPPASPPAAVRQPGETTAANRMTVDPQRAQAALRAAHQKFRNTKGGKNADYIPELAKVDPNLFGLALVTVDGKVFQVGDSKSPFSIQSVSKPFTAALVMDEIGAQKLEDKIGVDATGQAFNSVMAVEMNEDHRAGNPLVNAGAIATVSLVPASSADQRWQKVMSNLSAFAGQELAVNQPVYKSETATNTRNKAITSLLQAYEVLGSPPDQALDVYTRQCSVNVDARSLATMGATLANAGINPVTGKQVVSADTAKRVLALMATNGLYEATGEWIYRVGVPAKSGVGGGIVAVVPGRFAIATFSPPLDEAGNSVRGQKAIEFVVNELNANLFAAQPVPAAATGGSGRDGQQQPVRP